MPYALAAFLLFAADSSPQNWPGWRGPTADGLSRETGIPIKVGSENLKWKTAIPGAGHSSPIIWENSVFVTTAVESPAPSQRLLLRLDRETGKVLWSKVVLETGLEELHRLNSRASSTPATDGERVYTSFRDNDRMFVAAHDFDGKKIWEARPGPFASKHGYSGQSGRLQGLADRQWRPRRRRLHRDPRQEDRRHGPDDSTREQAAKLLDADHREH